jgi:hypothetical protein
MTFQVKEQTGKLDVSVPKTIHDRNAVVFQNPSCRGSGFVRDEEEGSIRALAGFVDKVPGRSRIRTPLDLHRHPGASAREADCGVREAIRRARLRDHLQPGDLPQDTESHCFERAF